MAASSSREAFARPDQEPDDGERAIGARAPERVIRGEARETSTA